MSRFFGRRKLTLAAITDEFGDEAALAAKVPPPVLHRPVVPDTRGATVAIDVAATIAPWLRLPVIDYARALTALPDIPPRDWSPRGQPAIAPVGDSVETRYLELAGVDVMETLDLVEQVREAIARGDS